VVFCHRQPNQLEFGNAEAAETAIKNLTAVGETVAVMIVEPIQVEADISNSGNRLGSILMAFMRGIVTVVSFISESYWAMQHIWNKLWRRWRFSADVLTSSDLYRIGP
jgi:hypothetical protein